jgi:hypothetical protein
LSFAATDWSPRCIQRLLARAPQKNILEAAVWNSAPP